jgi:hypothetical protein
MERSREARVSRKADPRPMSRTSAESCRVGSVGQMAAIGKDGEMKRAGVLIATVALAAALVRASLQRRSEAARTMAARLRAGVSVTTMVGVGGTGGTGGTALTGRPTPGGGATPITAMVITATITAMVITAPITNYPIGTDPWRSGTPEVDKSGSR